MKICSKCNIKKSISEFPKDKQKHLFTRGFTTTTGSGLGLYHIRSILKKMNGDIQFKGTGLDKLYTGASFEVMFK